MKTSTKTLTASIALACALGATTVAAAPSGARTYAKTCGYCHEYGVSGAPRLGDSNDWQTRAAQGTQVLYTHAIEGYRGMPARGANPKLSNAEVQGAVDYMLKKSLR